MMRILNNTAFTPLAIWLSRTFHPFVISVVVLFGVQLLAGDTAIEAAAWTLLSFAVVILPSLVFIFLRVQKGRYGDIDVSVREDRHLLYGIAGTCLILLLILLIWLQAPAIVQRTFQATLFAVAAGAIFNRYINKISLHSLTMAGCTTILFFVSPIAGVLLALMTLAVGWSRLHLTRHTLVEVLWGWLIGVLCVLVWFFALPVQ